MTKKDADVDAQKQEEKVVNGKEPSATADNGDDKPLKSAADASSSPAADDAKPDASPDASKLPKTVDAAQPTAVTEQPPPKLDIPKGSPPIVLKSVPSTPNVELKGIDSQSQLTSTTSFHDPEEEEDPSQLVIASLRTQLTDLHAQLEALNSKLISSYSRISTLEDDLDESQTNLQSTQSQVKTLEAQRKQHIDALQQGVLVERAAVAAELSKLMERATDEERKRSEEEEKRRVIEYELDDLSAGLFGQANSMVAEERIARASAEKRVEQCEAELSNKIKKIGDLEVSKRALKEEKLQWEREASELRNVVKAAERTRGNRKLRARTIPYREYQAFVDHLRSLLPSMHTPPAISTLLTLPFLARLVTEDSEPTLRLDTAPALNWLSRRSVLSAIHHAQLILEDVHIATLFLESNALASSNSSNGNINGMEMGVGRIKKISCTFCGKVIWALAEEDGGEPRPGVNWTASILKNAMPASNHGNGTGQYRESLYSRPPSPPPPASLQTIIPAFRVLTTNTAQAPGGIPTAATTTRSTPYPLCANGWCKDRLKTTLELWKFVREKVVDRIWEDEMKASIYTANSAGLGSLAEEFRIPSMSDQLASGLIVPPKAKALLGASTNNPSPPAQSRMGLSSLWGAISGNAPGSGPSPTAETSTGGGAGRFASWGLGRMGSNSGGGGGSASSSTSSLPLPPNPPPKPKKRVNTTGLQPPADLTVRTGFNSSASSIRSGVDSVGVTSMQSMDDTPLSPVFDAGDHHDEDDFVDIQKVEKPATPALAPPPIIDLPKTEPGDVFATPDEGRSPAAVADDTGKKLESVPDKTEPPKSDSQPTGAEKALFPASDRPSTPQPNPELSPIVATGPPVTPARNPARSGTGNLTPEPSRPSTPALAGTATPPPLPKRAAARGVRTSILGGGPAPVPAPPPPRSEKRGTAKSEEVKVDVESTEGGVGETKKEEEKKDGEGKPEEKKAEVSVLEPTPTTTVESPKAETAEIKQEEVPTGSNPPPTTENPIKDDNDDNDDVPATNGVDLSASQSSLTVDPSADVKTETPNTPVIAPATLTTEPSLSHFDEALAAKLKDSSRASSMMASDRASVLSGESSDSVYDAPTDGLDAIDPEEWVGSIRWEDRAWVELVRIRDDMFWARVGAAVS